jgi:uncharacterized membrane protein
MSISITKKKRFEALDVLRGLTMVIMALDHSRDFLALGQVFSKPLNIDLTTLDIFLTRWITHFAAPTFMFLAGIGLYFASRRRTKKELAFLAYSRGLWLIFLELTIVGFFWTFSPDFFAHPKIAVLFAIGVSMICFSFLVYLPKYAIAIIALLLIFGHNAFDAVQAEKLGAFGWIWHLLHEPGTISLFGIEIRVVYPFIPWIGVMAVGYLFGPVVGFDQERRKKIFLSLGFTLLALGTFLRISNLYGDPIYFDVYNTFNMTVMSFLNVTKYPPSLIYLCFMLGLAMLLMYLFDRPMGKISYILQVYGRVPFFFYILHIPILHIFGIIVAVYYFGNADWLFGAPVQEGPNDWTQYQHQLIPTYIAWILVLWLLYYPSKWFGDLKSRRNDWWLSYF